MRNHICSSLVVFVVVCLAGTAVHGAPKMYWADAGTGKIQRANLDGSDVEDLITGRPSPSDIALDLGNGKLYWGEAGPGLSGQIRRANLDGTEDEFVVDAGLRVSNIALDPVHGRVYWSAHFDNGGFIGRSNLDGTNVEVIRETGIEPFGAIAIDPLCEHLYWGIRDFPNGKIQRSALDGTGAEDFVTGDLHSIGGIAFDARAGRVYWANTSFEFDGKIQRANADGSNVETLVIGNLTIVSGLAVDVARGRMYWTDGGVGNQRIQRASLGGHDVERLVSIGLEFPAGIEVTVTPAIPALSNTGYLVMATLLVAGGVAVVVRRKGLIREHSRYLGIFMAVVLLHVNHSFAQSVRIPSKIESAAIDSYQAANDVQGASERVVFSTVVLVEGAKWLRLHFGDVELQGTSVQGNASYVRITSLADGADQILDARAMRTWRNSSAYFNGDSVMVELLSHSGTGSNRFVIDAIAVGESPALGSGGSNGICGSDDREPSTDPRSARWRFWTSATNPPSLSWCTAFLFDDRSSCLLSAGHCCLAICWPGESCFTTGAFTPVAEFNVPDSESDGTIVAADPDDQYPLARSTVEWEKSGEGNDWCQFGVYDNSNTNDSPLEAQGNTYTLASSVPEPDDPPETLRLTGYGCDDSPNTRNGTQQTSTDPYSDLVGTRVAYEVDMRGGNSGSAVEETSEELVFAINYATGCAVGGTNKGTAVDNANLVAELEDASGDCADCNNEDVPDNFDEGPCCQPDGECEYMSEACCDAVNGAIATSLNECNNGTPPDGGCCLDGGGCVTMSSACCTALGGTFRGTHTGCAGDGACCPLPFGQCFDTWEDCCDAQGGDFYSGESCASFACPGTSGPSQGP